MASRHIGLASPICIALPAVLLLSACGPVATPPATESTAPQASASAAPAADQERIAASIDISAPWTMTTGDGFLWVIAGSSIVKIDPQTEQVVATLSPGVQPEDIAFGDGALWVTSVAAGDLGAPSESDAVSRIDPETGEILATIKVARGPMSLVVTPEAVWVVNFGAGGEAISRIDPNTNQVMGEPIVTGRAPLSLAVGEGSVWVANHDAGTITRIDIATGQVVADIPVPSEPHRVAYGEGAAWAANFHTDSVTRIDPQTNQVVGQPIPIGHPAGNMAAGLGSVWVTSDYRGPVDAAPKDVVLVRLDPATDQVIETIQLGGHPIDVEILDGSVWVSLQGPDRLVRINP